MTSNHGDMRTEHLVCVCIALISTRDQRGDHGFEHQGGEMQWDRDLGAMAGQPAIGRSWVRSAVSGDSFQKAKRANALPLQGQEMRGCKNRYARVILGADSSARPGCARFLGGGAVQAGGVLGE